MLSKCANPSCSTPLIYLREGKIFMMEHGLHPHVRSEGPVLVKPGNRVEHFWLCGPCSVGMTIAYDRDRGATVVPKPKSRVHRAAAS
jgi:hypothetical protein